MEKYLNLEYLETFLKAAETGKLNVTAELTYQSHSTVSTQIKKLEDQVGMPLFVRSKNNLILTKGGEVLMDYAKKILDTNQAAFHSLTGSTWDGNILIGLPTDYADSFMQGIYHQLKKELPQYQLFVEFSRSRQIRRKIHERKLDIGLLAIENQYDGELPLWEEKLYWIASESFEPNPSAPLPVALFSDDCVIRNYSLSCLKNSARNFRIAFSSTTMDNLFSCVRHSAAVSLLPESMLTDGLKILPNELLSCPYTLKIGYTWNRKTNAEAIKKIISLFKKCYSSY